MDINCPNFRNIVKNKKSTVLSFKTTLRKNLIVIGIHCLFLSILTHAQEPTYDMLKTILDTRCTMCHSGELAPLGLQLDSYEGLLKGSRFGPVALDGDPENSEIIRRLKGESQPRMPLTGPPYLSDEEILLFENWIKNGLIESGLDQSITPDNFQQIQTEQFVSFADVSPIFNTHCTKCHTANGLMGGPPEDYRLDSYYEAINSNDRLRIVSGQPETSELFRRVRGHSLPQMPFDGPPFLSEEEIEIIKRWIIDGARDVNGIPASIPAGAKLRIHGTLDDAMTLNGLELDLTGARIKEAEPGNYVEVRGAFDAEEQLWIERIRGR